MLRTVIRMVSSPIASPSWSPTRSRLISPSPRLTSDEFTEGPRGDHSPVIDPMDLRSLSSPPWIFDGNAISAEEDEDYRSEVSLENSGSLNSTHLTNKQVKFTNWNDLSARLKRGIQSGNDTNSLFSQSIVGADVVLCVGQNYEDKYKFYCDDKKSAIVAKDESPDFVRFYAHRFILAASSGPFRAMLTGKMKEASQREVVLHGVSPSIVQKMLAYIYTGGKRDTPQLKFDDLMHNLTKRWRLVW